jgi:hypothetical protein
MFSKPHIVQRKEMPWEVKDTAKIAYLNPAGHDEGSLEAVGSPVSIASCESPIEPVHSHDDGYTWIAGILWWECIPEAHQPVEIRDSAY